MTQSLMINGLPRSLAQDGWWLDAQAMQSDSPSPTNRRSRGWAAGNGTGQPLWAGVVVLVLLADWLFWGKSAGLSLALFAGAIFAVAVWHHGFKRSAARPAGLLLLGALPIIEHVQPLSYVFLIISLLAALIWLRYPEMPKLQLVRRILPLFAGLPPQWVLLLVRLARSQTPRSSDTHAHTDRREAAKKVVRDWAFPLGGSLVFGALLFGANPIFARFLEQDIAVGETARRMCFWFGMAIFVVPFVEIDIPGDTGDRRDETPRKRRFGVHGDSVLRALVLFNTVIGFQSLSDIAILFGGADLPAGMSFSEYAHRGAYPLLMTAMLAGGFALVAHRHLDAHPLIKPLMLLWLAQNIILCGAALMRLDLYIEAFGWTYLRVRALIWMGLVAGGLCLAFWQVVQRRDRSWLALRTGVMTVTVLYLCCFVNFAHFIVEQNLQREKPDLFYSCGLDRMASAAIAQSEYGVAGNLTFPNPGYLDGQCYTGVIAQGSWQEWGFRRWRVARSLAAMIDETRP